MSSDNQQNNYDPLTEEIGALRDHFLPDGFLIKEIETIQQMKDTVSQLDNALLQLAQTSNLSADSLEKVTQEAFRLGDAVGRTGTEALSCIHAAIEAGYGMEDALKVAEEALKMDNISPGISDAEAAISHIKDILDGFGQNASFAPAISDALAGISEAGGTEFHLLAEGASMLAESASMAGISFEEMLGLFVGAYDSLKDFDQVTNGEKALFTTLKTTHSEAQSVYEVLQELHSAWEALDQSSRESFSISSVGEEHHTVFTALMNNWAAVEQAASFASDSFGAADEANSGYLDSISGKTAGLQNQVEKLSAALRESGILDFFLELGTTGVGALSAITDKIGALGTLGALGGGYLGAKGLGQHTCCGTNGCEAQEGAYRHV